VVSKDSGDNVRESEELAAQFWSQRPGAVKPPLEYSVEWALELAMERLRMLPYLPEALERCVRGMKDPKVLEVGCGMGFDGAYLVHSGARYTGLDRPQTVLHAARVMSSLAGSDWTLRSGDATKLPFVDGEFDVVYSFGVLHHIPRVSKAIVEAMRVLRHGGRFVAMVYNYDSVVAAAYRHASNREGTTDPRWSTTMTAWSLQPTGTPRTGKGRPTRMARAGRFRGPSSTSICYSADTSQS